MEEASHMEAQLERLSEPTPSQIKAAEEAAIKAQKEAEQEESLMAGLERMGPAKEIKAKPDCSGSENIE